MNFSRFSHSLSRDFSVDVVKVRLNLLDVGFVRCLDKLYVGQLCFVLIYLGSYIRDLSVVVGSRISGRH